MDKKLQSRFAVVLAAIGLAALAGAFYLTFVFPKTMQTWSAQERALSVAEQTLVGIGGFCHSFGLLLFPLLLLLTIGCGVWAVRSAAACRQEAAGG
jgi:type II secretory pathway component PulF